MYLFKVKHHLEVQVMLQELPHTVGSYSDEEIVIFLKAIKLKYNYNINE